MGDPGTNSTIAAWLEAARRADVAGGLEEIYAQVAGEIARRAPACWASGRCCNFEKAGHRLYVTGLEAAYTVSRLGSAASAGEGAGLTRAGLDAAVQRGGCPFQAANLCGVHVIKPLACRVYFCDRSAQEWQRELSERMHERVRNLHTRLAIEYRYAEWRSLLAMFVEAVAVGAEPVAELDSPGSPSLRLPILRKAEPN